MGYSTITGRWKARKEPYRGGNRHLFTLQRSDLAGLGKRMTAFDRQARKKVARSLRHARKMLRKHGMKVHGRKVYESKKSYARVFAN